jgi:large subunit ribosomal protein L1
MGKIRTRVLGLEEVEKKQKEEQKKKSQEKKKIRAPGLKGGERMVAVEEKEEEMEKLEKAKKILEEKPKATKKEEEKKVFQPQKKSRGKKYQELKKMIDKNKSYSIKEAIILLKKMNQFNFDQTVELHLNVDKTGLKGEVELPYSIGKKIRVEIVDDKVLAQIEKGELNFDVLITHPSYMPKLAKFARVLGPKGLMPNPKAGTISDKPEEVAKKFEKGLLRWKTEPKFPLIHQAVGKLSLDEEKLVANASAFLKSVGRAHIRSVFVKATMTPSIKLSLEELK